MKPGFNTSTSCLCVTNSLPQNNDQKNIFNCVKCKNRFHISCYDNPTIQILNNTITCLRCRLEIIEPYWLLAQNYLIPPMILNVNQPIDLNLTFTINKEDLELLEGKTHKIVIFCTKLKSNLSSNLIYEWPNESFQIFLDGNIQEYSQYSYIFLDLPLLEKNYNLKIICSEILNCQAVLGVSLAKKIDMKEIAKDIAKKNKLGFEEAKKKYKEIKESDLEFSAGIPTRDPMTSFFLYLPARGVNCEHISCFDLLSFISFNQGNYTNMRWKCPICKTVVNSHEIVIDLFLHKIVKEIRKNHSNSENIEKYSHIFIDEDGEWKPKEKFSNIWSQNNQTKDKPNEETNEIMSDSEIALDKCKPTKNESPEKIMDKCLEIVRYCLSCEQKEEIINQTIQKLKENTLLNSLTLKEIYDLLTEIRKDFMPIIENVILEKKNKSEKEIFNELESSYYFICNLIILWAPNNHKIIEIIYLLCTQNQSRAFDPFLSLEMLIVIGLILEKNPKELNENINAFQSFAQNFGFILRTLMEILKKVSKENFITMLKLISFLFPALHLPNKFLLNNENNDNNQKKIANFLNIFLLNFSDEDFVEIIAAIYPNIDENLSDFLLEIFKTRSISNPNFSITRFKEILSERIPSINLEKFINPSIRLD